MFEAISAKEVVKVFGIWTTWLVLLLMVAKAQSIIGLVILLLVPVIGLTVNIKEWGVIIIWGIATILGLFTGFSEGFAVGWGVFFGVAAVGVGLSALREYDD